MGVASVSTATSDYTQRDKGGPVPLLSSPKTEKRKNKNKKILFIENYCVFDRSHNLVLYQYNSILSVYKHITKQ
jgi:hypothetical protein